MSEIEKEYSILEHTSCRVFLLNESRIDVSQYYNTCMNKMHNSTINYTSTL